MLIAGELVDTDGHIPVINPVDESIVADVPDAGTADIDRAVAAAKAAWPAWRATGFAQRRAVLLAVSAAIGDHAEALAALLVRATGRPMEIGRASGRGSGCQEGLISVGADAL